jgi:hypothetical protein
MDKESRKIFRSAINTLRKETGRKRLGKKQLIEAAHRMANAERMRENLKNLTKGICGNLAERR